MIKVRIFTLNAFDGEYFLEGKITQDEFKEMSQYSFSTFTMGKITVTRNQIIGWKVLDEIKKGKQTNRSKRTR